MVQDGKSSLPSTLFCRTYRQVGDGGRDWAEHSCKGTMEDRPSCRRSLGHLRGSSRRRICCLSGLYQKTEKQNVTLTAPGPPVESEVNILTPDASGVGEQKADTAYQTDQRSTTPRKDRSKLLCLVMSVAVDLQTRASQVTLGSISSNKQPPRHEPFAPISFLPYCNPCGMKWNPSRVRRWLKFVRRDAGPSTDPQRVTAQPEAIANRTVSGTPSSSPFWLFPGMQPTESTGKIRRISEIAKWQWLPR